MLAQNFLVHPKTVRRLVGKANLSRDDLVLEIGPGEGIITRELARAAGRVIAVEFDPVLSAHLQERVGGLPEIEIVEGDFLRVDLPREPFKIFSNIPFNLTAEILLKLWRARRPPEDAFFIMQKEAAEKFTAERPVTESAILFQPWFKFEILAPVNRFEFRPVPSVDAVLLHMRARQDNLLDHKEKPLFQRFVALGFRSWKKSLKIAYKQVFTYNQWKRLARDGGFGIDSRPSELSFDQWLGIYRYFLGGVAPDKQQIVRAYHPNL